MNKIQRFDSALSSTNSHLNAAQTTIAVKKDDIAYTSASTAENQKVSENVYIKDPTTPDANKPKRSFAFKSSNDFLIILRPIITMVQCKNKIVKALLNTDNIFTQ